MRVGIGLAPREHLLTCLLLVACGGRSTLDLPSPVAHTSTAALDFGLADCGGSGDARAITLTNDATALPLTWTAKVDGPYVLQGPTSGQLFSHESASVTVLPEVPTTADAAFPVAGTLRFFTNDPARPTLGIPLTAIARGATLGFPASVDFGDIPLSAASPGVPLTVQNTGNVAADVAFAVAPGSDFAPGAASVHAEAGGSASALFHFAPTVWGPENGSVAVTVKGPVCGVVPSSIPLMGRGTKGVVLTSPGSLDFARIYFNATSPSCDDKRAGLRSQTIASLISGKEQLRRPALASSLEQRVSLPHELGDASNGGNIALQFRRLLGLDEAHGRRRIRSLESDIEERFASPQDEVLGRVMPFEGPHQRAWPNIDRKAATDLDARPRIRRVMQDRGILIDVNRIVRDEDVRGQHLQHWSLRMAPFVPRLEDDPSFERIGTDRAFVREHVCNVHPARHVQAQVHVDRTIDCEMSAVEV